MARQEAGWESAAAFARHIGVPEVTYRAHEKGTREISEQVAKQYAGKLGFNWGWIMTGQGDRRALDAKTGKSSPDGIGPAVDSVPQSQDARLVPANVDLSNVRPVDLMHAPNRKDLIPVYASAQAGPDGMTVDFNPVEWIRAPEALRNASNGFGVYVVNDSMEPALYQGDMIVVHAKRPPRRRDLVFLVTRDNVAYVKELVSMDHERVVVRQFNPPKEIAFARDDLADVKVVVSIEKVR